MAFSNNLRYFRKKFGLSQDDLATKLGYKSFTTIQKWESGVSEPSLSVAQQLAELFNISIDVLIGDSPIGTFTNSDSDIVRQLSERNELKELFNVAIHASKEDVEQISVILDKIVNRRFEEGEFNGK